MKTKPKPLFQDASKRPIGPCQAVCKYDEDDVCIGCFRRRQDIENWFFLDDAKKWDIIHEVEPKILESRKIKGLGKP